MKSGENDRGIKDWMEIFSELYSQADSNRTPQQFWIAIMAHGSSIGESIRRINFPDLIYYAAHIFCWLCSFVNKCKEIKNDIFSFTESISGVVSLKYPLVCGHCEANPCQCHPTKMDAIKDKAAHYGKLLTRREGIIRAVEEYSIALWQNIFGEIYGEQIHILTLENIGFHFLEEVGEGAIAVRKLSQFKRIVNEKIEGIDSAFLNELTKVKGIVENYNKYYKSEVDYTSKDPEILKGRIVDAKMSMVIEIADTFSWFCSILNKLDSISKNCKFKLQLLEEKLKEEYFEDNKPRCPTCKQKPCSCIFFF